MGERLSLQWKSVSSNLCIDDILENLYAFIIFIAGFGIAFEQPHKRSEITYYCMPKTLEAVWNLLEKKNIVRTVPYQSAIIFSLAMGIIAACYGNGSNPKTIKGFTLKACNKLWGDEGN